MPRKYKYKNDELKIIRKKFICLAFIIFVLLSASFGCKKTSEENPKEEQSEKGVVEMPKKVLFVIAQRNFQDNELKIPKSILESKDIKCEIASKTSERAQGSFGTTVKPDLSVREALNKIDDYNAVVFIGGSGMQAYFNDSDYLSLAETAYNKNKKIAAICIAPVILANAGILKGKNATVWDGEFRSMIEIKGAKYITTAVVVDDSVVTANGPEAAEEFGKKILELIS